MTEDGIRATNIRVVRAEPTFPSGNASFASHLRPSIICSAAMACWASPGVANVTNPNPLDLPVYLSRMICASSTLPYCAKWPCKVVSSVCQGTLQKGKSR